MPGEERRFVYPAPTPAVAARAATIDRPRILLKVCAPLADLLAVLPLGWRGHPQAFFMTLTGAVPAGPPLPAGYAIDVAEVGGVFATTVTASTTVVARGRAARSGDLLVFDQIATDPAHARRGLGSAVMRTLSAAGEGPRGQQALTATAAGHALYTALGWRTASLYSTAERIERTT